MAITDSDKHFCKGVELLKGVHTEALEALLADAQRFSVAAGTEIVHENDQGRDMYILVEGSVRISKQITQWAGGSEDVSKDLVTLRAEDHPHFGEMGLLEHDERTATVTALTACTLLKITQESFEQFAGQYPADAYHITRNMARVLSQRLRKANKDIVKLTTVLGIALSKTQRG